MTPFRAGLALALLLGLVPSSLAHSEVAPGAADAVAVVEKFGAALARGDIEAAARLLDPDVLVLESGGAENSREEYLAHHAGSDAEFLKGKDNRLTHRRARIDGDLAWVGTQNELHFSKDGKPVIVQGTETMVLKRTGTQWRIVHIHWSSHAKR